MCYCYTNIRINLYSLVLEENLGTIGIKPTLVMFKKLRTKVVVCTTSLMQAERGTIETELS